MARALVVGPRFFGYEDDIVGALRAHGYGVDFIDERPSNSSLAKAVCRVSRAIATRWAAGYFRERLERLAGRRYDLVLVVKGEVVPRWFLESLRAEQPLARFVYYTYDSLRNSPQCLDILDLFDERFSFDFDDVAARDDLRYKALFHAEQFVDVVPFAERRYNLVFIGTLHSERYRIVQRFADLPGEHFLYFYIPARWYFAWGKYVTGAFRDVPWSAVSCVKLSRTRVAEVFGDAKVVLDVQRTGQAGLTMRTFEVLAAGARLATVNGQIASTASHDPDRVAVLGDDDDDLERVRGLVSRPQTAGRIDVQEHAVARWVEDFLPTVPERRMVADEAVSR